MLSPKGKIVIIGSGNVGEAIGYTLMLRKLASEIVFVDLNEKRAEGSALDISHGIAFFRQINIRKGTYEECSDARIIIITAGMARKPGQTRLDLAKANVSIVRNITRRIMEHAVNPLLVVVSNPVDILTYVVQKESGLPAGQVIGTGTGLDTARFRYLISERCRTDVCDVNAYVLGEHGDSQVPIWSRVTIGGSPIQEFLNESPDLPDFDFEDVYESARDAGAEVISLKGATFYGIAMFTSRIVEAVLDDEKTILPVSHVLDSSYGPLGNVAISLPCAINHTGICRVVRLPLNEDEQAAMEVSAKTLQEFLENVLAEDLRIA